MSIQRCKRCDGALSSDEIALHRKLFGLGERSYLCLDCQAAYLNTTRQRLEQVILQYHRRGICVLFAKWDEEEGKGPK